MEVLQIWLSKERATWRQLIRALRSQTVDKEKKARTLEEKYCPQDALKTEEVKERTGRKRKRSVAMEQQLSSDVRIIRNEYKVLQTWTRLSLKNRKTPPSELIARLSSYREYPAAMKKDDKLLADRYNDLEKAENIDKIFIIVAPFWSFLDFDILEDIINAFGIDEDKLKLKNYKLKLKEILSSWKVESLQSRCLHVDADDNDDKGCQRLLCLKVDTHTMSTYRYVKDTIANILEVDMFALRVKTVEEGCIKLVFCCPKLSIIHLLPLSQSRNDQIKQIIPRILKMTTMDDKTALESIIFQGSEIELLLHIVDGDCGLTILVQHGQNLFVYDTGYRTTNHSNCLEKALQELIEFRSVTVSGAFFSTSQPNLKSIFKNKVIEEISVITPANINPSSCLESTFSSELSRLPLDHPDVLFEECDLLSGPSLSFQFNRKHPLVKHRVSYQTDTGDKEGVSDTIDVDRSGNDIAMQIKHYCSVLVTGETPIAKLHNLDEEFFSVFVVPHQDSDQCVSFFPEEARKLLWNPSSLQDSALHLAIYHKRNRFIPILGELKNKHLGDKGESFRKDYLTICHPETDLKAILQDADAKLSLFSEYSDKFYLNWYKKNKPGIFLQVAKSVSEEERRQYKRIVFLRNSLAWAHFYKHVNAEVYLLSGEDLRQGHQLEVLNGILIARFWKKAPCSVVITDSLPLPMDEIIQRDVRKLVFPNQTQHNVRMGFIEKRLMRSTPFFTINPCSHVQHYESEYCDYTISVDPLAHIVSGVGVEPTINLVRDAIDICDDISTQKSNEMVGHITYSYKPPPSSAASSGHINRQPLGTYMNGIGYKKKHSYNMTKVLNCLIGPTLVQQLRKIRLKEVPELIPALLTQTAAGNSTFALSPTEFSASDADVVVHINKRQPLQVGNKAVYEAKFIVKKAKTMQLEFVLVAKVNSKELKIIISTNLELKGTCGTSVGDYLYNTCYKEDAWHHVKDRTVGEILYVFLREENAISAIQSLPLFLSSPLIKCKINHYLTTVLVESQVLQEAHIYVNLFELEPVSINNHKLCIKIESLAMHILKLDIDQQMIKVEGNCSLNKHLLKFTCYSTPATDSQKHLKCVFVETMPAKEMFELFGIRDSPSSLQHPSHVTALNNHTKYSGGFVLSQIFGNTIESRLTSLFFYVKSGTSIESVLPPTCTLSIPMEVEVKTIVHFPSAKTPILGLEAVFNSEIDIAIFTAAKTCKTLLKCCLHIVPSIADGTYSSELVVRQRVSERDPQEICGFSVLAIVSALDSDLGKNIEDQIKAIPKIGDQVCKTLALRKIVFKLSNRQIILCEVHGSLSKLDIIDGTLSIDKCTINLSFSSEGLCIVCSGNIKLIKQYVYSVPRFSFPTLKQKGKLSFETYDSNLIFKDFMKEFGWLTPSVTKNLVLDKILDTPIRKVILCFYFTDKLCITDASISVFKKQIDVGLIELDGVDLEVIVKLVEDKYITTFSLQGFISEALYTKLDYDPTNKLLSGQVKVIFARTVQALSVLQLFSTSIDSYQNMKKALSEEFMDILSSDLRITARNHEKPGLTASLGVSISLPSKHLREYSLRYLNLETKDALKINCESTYVLNNFHFEYTEELTSKDSPSDAHLSMTLHKLNTEENMSLYFNFSEKIYLTAKVAAGPCGGLLKLCSAIDFAQAPTPEFPEFDVRLPAVFEIELMSGLITFRKQPSFQPAAFNINILIKEWLLFAEPEVLVHDISLKATWESGSRSQLSFTDCSLIFLSHKFILSGSLTTKDVFIKGHCTADSETQSPTQLQHILDRYTPLSAKKPFVPTNIDLPPMLVELKKLIIHIQEPSEQFCMIMVVMSPSWKLQFGPYEIPVCDLSGTLEWEKLDTRTNYKAYIDGIAELFSIQVDVKMLLEEEDKDSIVFSTVEYPHCLHYSQAIDHLLGIKDSAEIIPYNQYDPSTSGLSELVPSTMQSICFTEAKVAFNLVQKQFFISSKVEGWGTGSIFMGYLISDTDSIDYVASLSLESDVSFGRLSESLTFVDELVKLQTANALVSSAEFGHLSDITTKFHHSFSRSWVKELLLQLPFYESKLECELKLAEYEVQVGTTIYASIDINLSQGIITRLLQLGDTSVPHSLSIVTFIGQSTTKTDININAWIPRILLFGMLEFSDIHLLYRVKAATKFELTGAVALNVNLDDTDDQIFKFDGTLSVNPDHAEFSTVSYGNSLSHPCRINVVAKELHLALKLYLNKGYPNLYVRGKVEIAETKLTCIFIFVGIVFKVFKISLKQGLKLSALLSCCSIEWPLSLDIVLKKGKFYYAASQITLDEDGVTSAYERGYRIEATVTFFKLDFEIQNGIVMFDEHNVIFDARAKRTINLDFAKLTGEQEDHLESEEIKRKYEVEHRHKGPLLSYKQKTLVLTHGLEILDIPCCDGQLKCMPGSGTMKGEIKCPKFLWISEPLIQLEWSQSNGLHILELQLNGDVPGFSLLKSIEDVAKVTANSLSGKLLWNWKLCLKTCNYNKQEECLVRFILSGVIKISIIGLLEEITFNVPDMFISLPRISIEGFPMSYLLGQYILKALKNNSGHFIEPLLALIDEAKHFSKSFTSIRESIKGTNEILDIVTKKVDTVSTDDTETDNTQKGAFGNNKVWRGMWSVPGGSVFIVDFVNRIVLGYIPGGTAGNSKTKAEKSTPEQYIIEEFGPIVTVNAISSMAHEIHKYLKSCVDAQEYKTEEQQEASDVKQKIENDLAVLKSKANTLSKTLTIVADNVLTVTDVYLSVIVKAQNKCAIVMTWFTYNPEEGTFYTKDKGGIEYDVEISAITIQPRTSQVVLLRNDTFTLKDVKHMTKKSSYSMLQSGMEHFTEQSKDSDAASKQKQSTRSKPEKCIQLVIPIKPKVLEQTVCFNVGIQPKVKFKVKMLQPDKIVQNAFKKDELFSNTWMKDTKKQIEASGRLTDVTIEGKKVSKQHIINKDSESEVVTFTAKCDHKKESLKVSGTLNPVHSAASYIVQLVDETDSTVIVKQSRVFPPQLKYQLEPSSTHFPETSSGPYCVSALALSDKHKALSPFTVSELRIVRHDPPEILTVTLPKLDLFDTEVVLLKWLYPSSEVSLIDGSQLIFPEPGNQYFFTVTIVGFAVKPRKLNEEVKNLDKRKKEFTFSEKVNLCKDTRWVKYQFNLVDILKKYSPKLKGGLIFQCQIVANGISKLQSMPKSFPEFILLAPPKYLKVLTRTQKAGLHISWEYGAHAIGYRLELVTTKSQKLEFSKVLKCRAGRNGQTVLYKNDFMNVPTSVDNGYQLQMYSLGLGQDLIRCLKPTIAEGYTLHVMSAELHYLQELNKVRVTFKPLNTSTARLYTVELYQGLNVTDELCALSIEKVEAKKGFNNEISSDFALSKFHQKLHSGSLITAWIHCTIKPFGRKTHIYVGLPQEEILVLHSPKLKASFTYHSDGSIHEMKLVWSDVPGSHGYEYGLCLLNVNDSIILKQETDAIKVVIDFAQERYRCILEQLLRKSNGSCPQFRGYVSALGQPDQLVVGAVTIDVQMINYIIPSSGRCIVFTTTQLQKMWTWYTTHPVDHVFSLPILRQQYLMYPSGNPFPKIPIPSKLNEKFWRRGYQLFQNESDCLYARDVLMVNGLTTSKKSLMEWKKIDPFAKPFGTVTRKKIEYKKDNLECFGVSELRILLYTRCSGKLSTGKKTPGKIEIEIKIEKTKGKKTPDVATPSAASTASISQFGSTTDSNTSTLPSVTIRDREVPELPSTADAELIFETVESSANDIDETEKKADDSKEAKEPYIKDGDSESPYGQLGERRTDEPASTSEESGAPVGFVRSMTKKFTGAAKKLFSEAKGYLFNSEQLQEVVTKKRTIDLPHRGCPKTYCHLIQYTPTATNALVLNSSSRLHISLSIKQSGGACAEDTHLFVRFAGYTYSMKKLPTKVKL
ncbi:uncharacterized protein LOC135331030 isoform X2 [Halichondria panicea]